MTRDRFYDQNLMSWKRVMDRSEPAAKKSAAPFLVWLGVYLLWLGALGVLVAVSSSKPPDRSTSVEGVTPKR
jgi:hypothetical protein